MNASIFIAVDSPYAEADARALATALERHGFDAANREFLSDTQATKTAIESAVRRTLKKLTREDTLFVFYFGRGFFCGGADYLTCVDSRPDDLEATSVALEELFRHAAKAACGRVVFFLDAGCTADAVADPPAAIEPPERRLCFTACEREEHSHVFTDRRRGVWAYHLEQAIDGREPAALEGETMTVASLQRFLQDATAQSLRTVAPGQTQTPRVLGAFDAATPLLDFTNFAGSASNPDPQLGQIKDSILLAETTRSIRSLAGFATAKKHTTPERCDSYGRNFVVQLAADELQEEVARIRAALKRAFNFTRLQLSAENTGDGAATITTPSFNYNVSVAQHDSDPAAVVWRRSVDEITDPEQILSPQFESVFADVFRTVELTLLGRADLDAFVDNLEAAGGEDIRLEYAEDKQVTHCMLRFRGKTYEARVTPQTFAVVHAHALPPRQLLKSLFEVQAMLADRLQRQSLPFRTE